MKKMAMERVRVEILERLMFLLVLFRQYPLLVSETYFHEQVNGKSEVIIKIVNLLKDYNASSISLMLNKVFSEVCVRIENRGLVVAVDEAQLAQYILDSLVSVSAVFKYKAFSFVFWI
jgi:hypothetical protein